MSLLRMDIIIMCLWMSIQSIEEAESRNADIVMFGHTHKPYFSQKDGLTVLNRGVFLIQGMEAGNQVIW